MSESAEEADAWARRTSAGIAAGSREALASLYEHRFDLLVRTARERTRCDESFALDCVHDVMLRVVHGMRGLDSAASLDAWLRRAVLTVAIDRLRSEMSRARRERGVARPEVIVGASAELVERLREDLAALESDARQLLDLRFRRGLSLKATADATGVAAKTVESRVRRLLSRLRTSLRRGEPVEVDEELP